MRVLAVSSPIYAHTLNAAPFLTGLTERGAEVHWAVAAPLLATARGLVDLAGDGSGRPAAGSPGLAPVRSWDTGPAVPFRPRSGRIREVSARYDWLLRDGAGRLGRVETLLRDLRPDVLLTDSLGYAAALAAERAGLPWVSFGDGPLHHPDEHTPPFGAGLPYRTARPWVWRNQVVQQASRRLVMRGAQARYAELRAGLGLPPVDGPVLEAALSPYLHLHCGVPELEYPRAGLPDHVHFVGAPRPPVGRSWRPPPWWAEHVVARSGRVVLATQGTLRDDPAELLTPTVQALLASGRPGVVTTGRGDPRALGGPGSLPSRTPGGPAVVVEQFVPYAEVLAHASALVTNGGWTGVLLALAHGVPVVQVGRSEEKADIGRRVEWAGVGLHLGPRPGPRRLAAALDRVETDPAIRRAAARVAASLADRDPGRDGSELVLRLMG